MNILILVNTFSFVILNPSILISNVRLKYTTERHHREFVFNDIAFSILVSFRIVTEIYIERKKKIEIVNHAIAL